MITLVAPVLAASLLGSPHCASMCGPFACLYAGQTARAGAWRAHVTYNLGRLTAYLGLGAVAGLAGAALNELGALARLHRTAAVVSGLLMILWGAATIVALRGVRLPGLLPPVRLRGLLGRLMARFQERPPTIRAMALGLFTTLLPCGWLYVFVAVAAGTGSAAAGMVVMTAFWLGTLPMLAGLGFLAGRALGPLRARLPVATAVMLMILGLLTIAGRLSPEPFPPSAHHAGH